MTENGLMESSQTEKLFYNNSHQKSFEATVLSCQKKENYYEIVLDQTAFFPEGGGQYAGYRISGGCKGTGCAGAGGTDPPQNGPGTARSEKR